MAQFHSLQLKTQEGADGKRFTIAVTLNGDHEGIYPRIKCHQAIHYRFMYLSVCKSYLF